MITGDVENGNAESGNWLYPAIIQEQMERLKCDFQHVLGDSLVGIYVHGSLALGGFNPERSDIDLLIVVRNPLPVKIKRRAVKLLLRTSGQPCPVEMTIVTVDALHAGEHPMALEIHYSEMWRRQCEAELAGDVWRDWNRRYVRDPDLAGQVAVARQQGIALFGEPGACVLPLLPSDHICASFLQDCERALAEIASDPVYGILNPLRAYFYCLTGRLISKAEAGEWALEELPFAFQPVVSQALAPYVGGNDAPMRREALPAEPTELAAFADYLRERIAHCTKGKVHVSSTDTPINTP